MLNKAVASACFFNNYDIFHLFWILGFSLSVLSLRILVFFILIRVLVDLLIYVIPFRLLFEICILLYLWINRPMCNTHKKLIILITNKLYKIKAYVTKSSDGHVMHIIMTVHKKNDYMSTDTYPILMII